MSTRRSFLTAGVGALASCALWARPKRYDAIVVGAGLAGLSAAQALTRAGLKVLVLEGRERVGGRLCTVASAGLRFDLGGVEIASSYAGLLDLAQQTGVALKPTPPRAPAVSSIYYAGEWITQEAWSNHPLNPLPEALRSNVPGALLSRWLAADMRLPQASLWQAQDKQYLDVSLFDDLRAQGVDPGILRLAEIGANYNDLRAVSLLDVLRRDALRKEAGRNVQLFSVDGGSQALAEGIARHFKLEVRTGAVVRSFSKQRRGFELGTERGALNAEKLILALPAGPLQELRWQGVSLEPAKALFARPYTAVTTVHLKPTRAFWQDDGMALNMWIDGPLERVFGVPGADGEIERIIVWINGKQAIELDRLGDEAQIAAYVMSELARVRPSTRGALELLAAKSWSADPMARGAYAEMAPGQMLAAAKSLATMTSWLPAGLALAGEHMSFAEAGMEAAVQSGLRAAEQVMQGS
jgi:monoamine oxidase